MSYNSTHTGPEIDDAISKVENGLPIPNGGTGAKSVEEAKVNLEILDYEELAGSGDTKPLGISYGGTGANTPDGARSNLGLGNVDNTSDADKPISTAQQAALELKAPLESPNFTGNPTTPTPTNNLEITNKKYVDTTIDSKINDVTNLNLESLTVNSIDYTLSDAEYTELMNLLGGGLILKLIDYIYPVGSVVASINSDFDPNKLYSNQTWTRFAEGRTLVGVGTGSDGTMSKTFSNPEDIGGEYSHTLTIEEMPAHENHLLTSYKTIGSYKGFLANTVTTAYGTTGRGWNTFNGNEIYPAGIAVGGSEAHNNVQPYVTVYYWKRTE